MKPVSRRVPRKVGGGQDDHGGHDSDHKETTTSQYGNDVVVKRPSKVSSSASRNKKLGSGRISASLTVGEGECSISSKSQPMEGITIHATSKQLGPAAALPFRVDYLNSGPSYSPEHLKELKDFTVAGGRSIDDVQPGSDASRRKKSLDISSKFGEEAMAVNSRSDDNNFRIPTQEEIREKKERRRRLAREPDFISLNDDADDDAEHHSQDSDRADPRSHSLIIHVDETEIPSKYGESRLVHDDEDIAEGFDDFVEDPGKVTLGGEAAKEQQRQRRMEIEDQIQSAQHGYGHATSSGALDENSSEDEEDIAQSAAYDAVQIRAGAYGISSSLGNETDKESKLKKKLELPSAQPPSDFRSVISRLFDVLSAKEQVIEATKMRINKLEKERAEIENDEARIKDLLEDAAERFEKLKEGSKVENFQAESESNERGLITIPSTEAPESFAQPAPLSSFSLLSMAMTQRNMAPGSGVAASGMARMPSDEEEYSD